MTEPPSHPPPLDYEPAPPEEPQTIVPPVGAIHESPVQIGVVRPDVPHRPPPPPTKTSNFDRAFEQVIGLEGGYVHDPDDYGGETNWGISKRSYPELDIANLTLDQAKEIYQRDYWNRMRLSEIKDQNIAMELFEQGVNLGRSRAIKHLQKSLNMMTDEFIEEDGVIGPETLAAVNNIPTEKKSALLKCLDGFQFDWYRRLVDDNSQQKKFFVGWLRRIA